MSENILAIKIVKQPLRSFENLVDSINYVGRLRHDQCEAPSVNLYAEDATPIFRDTIQSKEERRAAVSRLVLGDWSELDPFETGRVYEGARFGYHFVLSLAGDAEKETGVRLLEAAKLSFRRELGDAGWRSVFGLHTDTDHPHIHLIINAVNGITGRKWRNSKDFRELENLRQAIMVDIEPLGVKLVKPRRASKKINSLLSDLKTLVPGWLEAHGLSAWARFIKLEQGKRLGDWSPQQKRGAGLIPLLFEDPDAAKQALSDFYKRDETRFISLVKHFPHLFGMPLLDGDSWHQLVEANKALLLETIKNHRSGATDNVLSESVELKLDQMEGQRRETSVAQTQQASRQSLTHS